MTTAALLALAVSLGTWQVHRLAWKTALLADIGRGEAAAAVPLAAEPAQFSKVVAEGTLRAGAVGRYGVDLRTTPSGRVLGAYVLAVLERQGQAPVLADLGWVPDSVAYDLPSQPVRIEGYVRPPERAPWFGAGDDPARRRFFALDPAPIGTALGVPGVAPFTLVALGPAVPGTWPQPATALPRPPNDHLSYAITWFALAALLLGVFLLHARKVLRA